MNSIEKNENLFSIEHTHTHTHTHTHGSSGRNNTHKYAKKKRHHKKGYLIRQIGS